MNHRIKSTYSIIKKGLSEIKKPENINSSQVAGSSQLEKNDTLKRDVTGSTVYDRLPPVGKALVDDAVVDSILSDDDEDSVSGCVIS
jgi:hypothetical protein